MNFYDFSQAKINGKAELECNLIIGLNNSEKLLIETKLNPVN